MDAAAFWSGVEEASQRSSNHGKGTSCCARLIWGGVPYAKLHLYEMSTMTIRW